MVHLKLPGRTTWSGREYRQAPGGDLGRQNARDGEKGKASWQAGNSLVLLRLGQRAFRTTYGQESKRTASRFILE